MEDLEEHFSTEYAIHQRVCRSHTGVVVLNIFSTTPPSSIRSLFQGPLT